MASLVRLTIGPIGFAIGLAFLWLLLAILRPATTFHLAPILVAAAPPLAYRLHDGGLRTVALRMTAAGSTVAVAATGLLALLGLLEGPSLLPFGGALVESWLAAGAGAVIGLVSAVLLPAPVRNRLRPDHPVPVPAP